MKNNERGVKRILILSAIFFLSGISFFYFRMAPSDKIPLNNQQVQKQNYAAGEMILKNMPEPKEFRNFTYHKGDNLKVSGECKDLYYTILVYPKEVDYRQDPSSAKYNVALPCGTKSFYSQEINLDNSNLKEDSIYYVVRAHQGSQNNWYNPY